MLTYGSTTSFSTANDFGLSVYHLADEFKILVVNIHRPRTNPIDKDRVSSLRFRLWLSPFSGRFRKLFLTGQRAHLILTFTSRLFVF